MSTDDPFTSAEGRAADKQYGDVINHRYWMPNPDNGRGRYFTRVTTFAKAASDTYKLDLWRQRMAVKGVTMRPALLARAASLDVTADREEFDKLVSTAREVADTAGRADLGSALHSFTEQHDRGLKPKVPAPWDRDLETYVALLEKAELTPDPELIERTVLNRTFDTVGTLDRSTMIETAPPPITEKVRRILDLKTGRSLEWGWGEIAVQLYLYATAELLWNPDTLEWEPFPEHDHGTALVVHLPVGEATATLYEVDLSLGEAGAFLARKVRNWRSTRTDAYVKPVEKVTL